MPRPEAEERMLSPLGLSEFLEIPISTIYRWNYAGGGPPRLRIGKHVRYRMSDVMRWLDDQRSPAAS